MDPRPVREPLTDRLNVAAEVVERLRAVVGERGLITDPQAMAPMLEAWRDNWRAEAACVVQPATTAEVQAVVRICAAARTQIVPQGGNTGLTGAGLPDATGRQVVVSTRRMNGILDLDLPNDTVTVQAGCVLETIQAAARNVGRLFPLSLGAQGSCAIGGNISTNAGGIHVLRYGSTRQLVAGLEVVLADGRVWDGLRGLRKDSAGYDLKQLFIGAEGTLGIITAAVLKLSPLPRQSLTALIGMNSPAAALEWLMRLKENLGDQLAAFELLQRTCIDVVRRHVPALGAALPSPQPWSVLLELTSQSADMDLSGELERVFEAAIEAGEVIDGVIASSQGQSETLWRLRESISDCHRKEGFSFNHDVSVPVSKVPAFLDRADAALQARFPGIRPFSFGHLGDGNVHYNPLQAEGEDRAVWVARLPEVNRIVHDLTIAFGGSISAEHGIGRLRLSELRRTKPPLDLELMRAIKAILDPHNLFNPGKIFDPGDA